MGFRVKITPRALRDAEEIYKRVVSEAPLQGSVWFEGLIDTIRSLADHPRRCPMAEGFLPAKGIRQILYGRRPYILYFRLKGNEVQLLHIRFGARKPWVLGRRNPRPFVY